MSDIPDVEPHPVTPTAAPPIVAVARRDAGLAALAALAREHGWHGDVADAIARLVREGDDAALLRVNPLRFAREHGLAEQPTVDGFLHAARLGLFEMEWNLFCPACGDIVKRFSLLRSVDAHCFCDLCQIHFEAQLDDLIEVSFTVAVAVRPIRFHAPQSLAIDDYFFRYVFNQGLYEAGGLRWVDWLRTYAVRGLGYLAPGETLTVELDARAGIAEGCDRLNHLGWKLDVSGAPTAELRVLRYAFRLDGVSPGPQVIAPGPVRFEIENRTGRRGAVILLHVDRPFSTFHEPFLSGKRLLNTRTFRTLFADAPASDTGLAIKDLTVLFTDVKGSTALYDRLGDLDAFLLVTRHFRALESIIEAHHGVVVKTIGDSVMATFDDPLDGVQAAPP